MGATAMATNEAATQCTYCANPEPAEGWRNFLPPGPADEPLRPVCQACIRWGLAWGKLAQAAKEYRQRVNWWERK